MIKRITFLRRLDALSLEQFHRHWRDVHGPIGARFAGVRRYLQNRLVVRVPPSPLEDPSFFDGIVEYWFEESAGPRPGRDPDVSRDLEEDAPLFVDGLTGFEVDNPIPYVRSRFKLWIVGRWRGDGALPDELGALAHRLAAAIKRPSTVVAHAIAPDAPVFARGMLADFTDAPRAIVIAMIGNDAWSASDSWSLEQWLRSSPAPFLRDIEAFVTEEVAIVAGPERESLRP